MVLHDRLASQIAVACSSGNKATIISKKDMLSPSPARLCAWPEAHWCVTMLLIRMPSIPFDRSGRRTEAGQFTVFIHHNRIVVNNLYLINLLLAWLSGSALVLINVNVRSCSKSGLVNTWMGDRRCAGKPFRYVTSHVGQLSLPSLLGKLIRRVPAFLTAVRRGAFPCVGWQLTLWLHMAGDWRPV